MWKAFSNRTIESSGPFDVKAVEQVEPGLLSILSTVNVNVPAIGGERKLHSARNVVETLQHTEVPTWSPSRMWRGMPA
jgi:hypothetical protein